MALRIENTEPGTAGPLFEDLLREQGTCDQSTETAIKRVLAYQLEAVMKEQHISKEASFSRGSNKNSKKIFE